MKKTLPAAALVALFLFLNACQSTPPAPSPEQPKQEAKEPPAPQAPVAQAGKVEPAQKPEGQEDDPNKLLEKFQKEQSLTEQERRFRAEQRYKEGLDHYNNHDFQKAKRSLEDALNIWPHHDEARKLLNNVNQVEGQAAGEFQNLPEDAKNLWIARMQQQIIEIRRGILDGERFYRAGKYDEALKELNQAEFRLNNFPYELDIKHLLPKVQSLIKDVEYTKKKAAESAEERKKTESLEETRKLAEAQRKEILMFIRTRLELAFNAFDQKRYDRCIQLCVEILAVDPHYKVAKELLEDAQKTRHRYEYRRTLEKKILAWKDMMAESSEVVIPYSEFVQFPPPKVWDDVKKRAEYTIQVEQTEQEDIDILQINSTLEMTRLATPPHLERTTLKEALDYIRAATKLNIHEDPAVREILKKEERITFRMSTPVPVRTMLTTLLSHFGLAYTIKDKAVYITRADGVDGPAIIRVYDLNNILPKPNDFPEYFTGIKPSLNARGTSNVNYQYTATMAPKEARPSYTADDVVKMITTMVMPGTWDREKNRTIVVTPSNQMIVSHTKAVHAMVHKIVDNIKSYAATMVLVEAKFIMADDNFLEDLGVEWRQLPYAAPPGVIIDGTELTAPPAFPGVTYTPQGPPPFFWSVAPGIIIQETARQESWDLRAQTFHTWMKRNTLGSVEPSFVLGNRIANQGGIGITMQWLGEHQMQSVMRAVWKNEKATLLHNPKLMIFNGQRSHIVILKQTAFIQGLDVSAGAIGGALDPAIGVIQDGVVLDVRPIVSHDRKWVTMELQPTLSLFMGFRPVASAGQIELPWIMFQRVQTTVTVPDKGTMILAGLKDIYRRELNADTPFLGNIPIVQILASRKSKGEEHRNIIIMATPHIIDMTEYEEGRAPGQLPTYSPEIPIHPPGQ